MGSFRYCTRLRLIKVPSPITQQMEIYEEESQLKEEMEICSLFTYVLVWINLWSLDAVINQEFTPEGIDSTHL